MNSESVITPIYYDMWTVTTKAATKVTRGVVYRATYEVIDMATRDATKSLSGILNDILMEIKYEL